MHIKEFLEKNNIWHRFIEKQETIHTADAAAKAGMDLKRVSKSLVLLDEDKNPIMAIIPGDKKLSFSKLRQALNLKKARLVPFEEAENYSGYPPGATPMVFHKIKMRVVLDKNFDGFETIFGGGGTRTSLLELKREDIIRLNEAIVADIVE